MALNKYIGSCHCKRIKFEAEVDLEQETGRCNCSYCFATRNWGVRIKPEQFKWISGEKESGSYGFRENSLNKHHFCKNCGTTICTIGDIPQTVGKYVSVRISTLHNVSPEVFAKAPIKYMDGLHDNWFHEPKITSYL